jgi:chaperonin GroES
MSVHVTPLHDRVLVRRLEEKETAKGGIIIPDTAKEKPQEGEVMAIGAARLRRAIVDKAQPTDITCSSECLTTRSESTSLA